MPRAKGAAAPRPRVVPTCFEVYIGKKLIGWVDTNFWARGHRCQWTGGDPVYGEGRCKTLRQGVDTLRILWRKQTSGAQEVGP